MTRETKLFIPYVIVSVAPEKCNYKYLTASMELYVPGSISNHDVIYG
jgi:hypothetical protein